MHITKSRMEILAAQSTGPQEFRSLPRKRTIACFRKGRSQWAKQGPRKSNERGVGMTGGGWGATQGINKQTNKNKIFRRITKGKSSDLKWAKIS